MTYASEVLADAPELYWQLRDSVGSTAPADSSGNGHASSVIAGASFHFEFGHPGLIAGGFTCLKMPVVGPDDVIRGDNVGPSSNLTVEAVIRPHSAGNYNFTVHKPGVFSCEISVTAGPSSNPGVAMTVDEGAGTHQTNAGMTAIPVGQRTHVAFEMTGTSGVVGAGGPRLKIYVDNSLLVDTALATTLSLDLFSETNYIQIFGYGTYVEEVAVYPTVLSTTRIGDHIAEFGDVLGFGEATDTQSAGQIGFPQTGILAQAPYMQVWDPHLPYVQTFHPFEGIERAFRIMPAGTLDVVELGQAVETETAQGLTPVAPFEDVPLTFAAGTTRTIFPPRRLASR